MAKSASPTHSGSSADAGWAEDAQGLGRGWAETVVPSQLQERLQLGHFCPTEGRTAAVAVILPVLNSLACRVLHLLCLLEEAELSPVREL